MHKRLAAFFTGVFWHFPDGKKTNPASSGSTYANVQVMNKFQCSALLSQLFAPVTLWGREATVSAASGGYVSIVVYTPRQQSQRHAQ